MLPSFHSLFTHRETEAKWLPCHWEPVPAVSMWPTGPAEGAGWPSCDHAQGSQVMEGLWGWGGEDRFNMRPWHVLPQRQALKDRGRSDPVPTLRAAGRKRRLLPELIREDIKEEVAFGPRIRVRTPGMLEPVHASSWELTAKLSGISSVGA